MDNNTHLVIMAGGIGSRFWPISTPETPKQFIDILGTGRTLIQATVDRFKGICPMSNIWVVTSAKYKDLVKRQLSGIPDDNILLEPCMRNTAPCIAYVSRKIAKRYPEANLVISPSDHIVTDILEFQRVVRQGLDFVRGERRILTLGMLPTRPETGFGYIKIESGETGNTEVPHTDSVFPTDPDHSINIIPKPQLSYSEILKVDSFKEKPDLHTAERYLAEGGYYWNAGIFLWNVDTIEKEFRELQPGIAEVIDKIEPSLYTEKEQETVDRYFPECESISIDYAIMEKASHIYVFPADFGWSDIGTWGSLHRQLESDGNGNAMKGEKVSLVECKDCIVSVSDDMKMVVQGLEGYIVAEQNGVLMICRKEDEQRIKFFSETLKNK